MSGNLSHAIKRSNTVRLTYACGDVIVRSVKLDPRELLDGELTPVLVHIKNSILVFRSLLYIHRIDNFAVCGVVKIELVSLTVGFTEVFTNLEGYGDHHFIFIKDCRTFNTTAGSICHDPDISILILFTLY